MTQHSDPRLRNKIVERARESLPKKRERMHTEPAPEFGAGSQQGWVCYPISDVEIAYIDAIASVLHEEGIE